MLWLIVLVVIVILLVGIAAFVHLVPINVFASGRFDPSKVNFEVSLSWVGLTFWTIMPSKRKEVKEKQGENKEKQEGLSVKKIYRLIFAAWDSIPAFEIPIRFLGKSVRIKNLDVTVVIGTGDPADTALLAGGLWSLSSLFCTLFPTSNISVQPDLIDASFNASVKAELRVRVGYAAIGFMRAYTKRPFRRFISEIRSMR